MAQFNTTSGSAFSDSKPHFETLNGLRGVAAIMVIFYHIGEAFATSTVDQGVNHGYLAVDFFFVLSGFVISYAYDDRWGKMSLKNFFKRRLIRLHPMIILGAVLGAISFLIQGGVQWDGTQVPIFWVFVSFLLSALLIPVLPGAKAEVRGNGEMFPLNGPSWSLFFEYIGNILYALIIRRLSNKALKALVFLAGAGLVYYVIADFSGYGNLGVGWTVADHNFPGGFLRLMFSFSAGMLVSRLFKPKKLMRGAFWKLSLVIIVLLSLPYLGNEDTAWINGLYDVVVVILIFPLLVYLGASARPGQNEKEQGRRYKFYRFLGDISYPLYIIHYPSMYLFYAWAWGHEPHLTFAETWPIALLIVCGNIALAYGVMKLYDLPIRRYLAKRFLKVR